MSLYRYNSIKCKHFNAFPICSRPWLFHRGFKTRLSETYSGISQKGLQNVQLKDPTEINVQPPTSSIIAAVKRLLNIPSYEGSTRKKQIQMSLTDSIKQYRFNPELREAVLEGYYHYMLSYYQKRKPSFVFLSVSLIVFALVLSSVIKKAKFSIQQQLYPDTQIPQVSVFENISFDDVKGCDEAKDQLKDVVEFLRNPVRFNELGAKLPKGILLVGPPGVGKTLLARAVATEAKVRCYCMSGSYFDGVFVGIGSLKVRQLFKHARENAPCIIFIDEFDGVGRKRYGSSVHANQTVNQLLTEMDGMSSSEGVIILAATNMKDNLDEAVLRAGRFDTEVNISPPDLRGRVELFEYYIKKIRLHPDIKWEELIEKLARKTSGSTGASIKNIVNQAAVRAALLDRTRVIEEDFWYALDKIFMGLVKPRIPDEDVNIRTAYHEAGHALIHIFNPKSFPLSKVTILPRNQSLGHTSFVPEDSYGMTRAQLKAQIDVSLGGRVAEELIFGKEIGVGARSDFKVATSMAERMVKQFGMSENVGPRFIPDEQKLSDATKELIDSEVQQILSDSYERVRTLLTAHSAELKLLAEALLKYEVLDAKDVKVVLSGKQPDIKISFKPRPKLPSPSQLDPVLPPFSFPEHP